MGEVPLYTLPHLTASGLNEDTSEGALYVPRIMSQYMKRCP